MSLEDGRAVELPGNVGDLRSELRQVFEYDGREFEFAWAGDATYGERLLVFRERV